MKAKEGSRRNICLKLYVTPEEKSMIKTKMEQLGTTNMAAYLRKPRPAGAAGAGFPTAEDRQ